MLYNSVLVQGLVPVLVRIVKFRTSLYKVVEICRDLYKLL